MADFEDRDARPGQREQIALDLLQDGQRQNGRTGGEVVDAVNDSHRKLH
jgi:hypothetical protein